MHRSLLTLLFTFALVACFTIAARTSMSSSAAMQTQTQTQTRGNPTIKVWVDTQYGLYHCPVTKLYGKTKQGVYMTQKQAQDRGYRPAYGVYCNVQPTPTPRKLAKPTAAY
jgi:hypothetical protein